MPSRGCLLPRKHTHTALARCLSHNTCSTQHTPARPPRRAAHGQASCAQQGGSAHLSRRSGTRSCHRGTVPDSGLRVDQTGSIRLWVDKEKGKVYVRSRCFSCMVHGPPSKTEIAGRRGTARGYRNRGRSPCGVVPSVHGLHNLGSMTQGKGGTVPVVGPRRA